MVSPLLISRARPMRGVLGFAVLTLAGLGGCPPQSADPVVHAVITSSVLTGNPPLQVSFAAGGSTSRNPGDLKYLWDFGDDQSATDANVQHTYTHPGYYQVTLTVTDATGAVGIAAADVRVRGQAVTAVITPNPAAGPAPLSVRFSAADSVVPDDVIRFYHWDFGDTQTSTATNPVHTYTRAGQYPVTLQIETGGGVQGETSLVINVGALNGSLQFSGSNLATLPIGGTQNLTTLTFQAWVEADTEGGTVASLGAGAATIDLQPSQNSARAQVNGGTAQGAASSLAGRWHQIALIYDSGAGKATLYLDGGALASGNATGPVAVDRIVLGNGFRGKITEVRLWSVASADLLSRYANQRLQGTEANLLGYWPIYEGTGQVLSNPAHTTSPGVLGTTNAVESSDPAWSADGPDFAQ